MVSYRNKDIFKNSALRRLAGKKEPVSTDLPTAGDNVAPSPTSTSSALKDSAIRTPSYAGNTNRPAGNVSSLTALSKQASNSSPPLNSQPGQGQPGQGQLSQTKPAAQQSWTEGKMIGGMNVGDFVSMAGSLGNAIAPNTAEGRVGKVAAGYALREQERVKNEPDKELKRRKTLAEIAKLKAPVYEKRTSLMKNYEDAVKGGFKGTLADWKSVGKKTAATQKPKSGFNMVDGKLMKGNWDADNKFTSQRLASPKEKKDWNAEEDTSLTYKEDVSLGEDLTKSAYADIGYHLDEDQGVYVDQEGNPVSPDRVQEIEIQVEEDQEHIAFLRKNNYSMGAAKRQVRRLRGLQRTKYLDDTYNSISAMDIESQAKALAELPKADRGIIAAELDKVAAEKTEAWKKLRQPNVSDVSKLNALDKEIGYESRTNAARGSLVTYGEGAEQFKNTVSDTVNKILPSLKGFNKNLNKIPGFSEYNKRIMGQ